MGAHLQTWQYCFAILTPQRAQALPQLRKSVGGLRFAGDHTSETAATHGAFSKGLRFAGLIRSTRVEREPRVETAGAIHSDHGLATSRS